MKPATTTGLAALIGAYAPQSALEQRHRDTILQHVLEYEQPFDPAILHAHLTGSALILSASGSHVLLGFHRKLAKWLQMGGHGEPGEIDPAAVAMREAEEESGIDGLQLHPTAPAPVDLDVHTIPARAAVPEHLHLDIRYLICAPENAVLARQEEEQEDLRWFTWTETEQLDLDASLQRLITKARFYAAR